MLEWLDLLDSLEGNLNGYFVVLIDDNTVCLLVAIAICAIWIHGEIFQQMSFIAQSYHETRSYVEVRRRFAVRLKNGHKNASGLSGQRRSNQQVTGPTLQEFVGHWLEICILVCEEIQKMFWSLHIIGSFMKILNGNPSRSRVSTLSDLETQKRWYGSANIQTRFSSKLFTGEITMSDKMDNIFSLVCPIFMK